MKQSKTIRIAVTGPESTGKSTLAAALAKQFDTVWVPEYARTYIETLNRDYNYKDILQIAKGQLLAEDTVSQSQKLVFADTELLVTKIWCEVKYNRCHSWILDEIGKRKYDLVLLCNIDLPWQSDPQREHPDKREMLMDLYRCQSLLYYSNVIEVSGMGENRIENAIEIVKQFLKECGSDY